MTIWPRKHKRKTPSQAFTRSKQIFRIGRSLKICGTVHWSWCCLFLLLGGIELVLILSAYAVRRHRIISPETVCLCCWHHYYHWHDIWHMYTCIQTDLHYCNDQSNKSNKTLELFRIYSCFNGCVFPFVMLRLIFIDALLNNYICIQGWDFFLCLNKNRHIKNMFILL